MPLRGLNMRGISSSGLQIFLILCGIALMIYTFLKGKTSNTGANIYKIIKSHGFVDPLAKFVLSQAAHETAVLGVPFQSNICRNNNNLFGMKYAGQVYADGEKNGYAYYTSVTRSVSDFTTWWNRHRTFIFPLYVTSIEDYVKFLKGQSYFEDTIENYTRGCKYFYNQFFA